MELHWLSLALIRIWWFSPHWPAGERCRQPPHARAMPRSAPCSCVRCTFSGGSEIRVAHTPWLSRSCISTWMPGLGANAQQNPMQGTPRDGWFFPLWTHDDLPAVAPHDRATHSRRRCHRPPAFALRRPERFIFFHPFHPDCREARRARRRLGPRPSRRRARPPGPAWAGPAALRPPPARPRWPTAAKGATGRAPRARR